mgnify:CR=1 FL=1
MLGWRSRASQLISVAGSATQVCREVIRQQSIANGLLEFGRVPPHTLPLAFSGRHLFPHPDIREAKFSTERLAIFVFACRMVIPSHNREVLAVHSHFVGRNNRAGVRVGIIFDLSEVGFLIEHSAVTVGVGKVVGPDSFQEIPIFGGVNYAPLFRELRDLFRDLFGFFSRYRRLRRASGNTSRQHCTDSNEHHQ